MKKTICVVTSSRADYGLLRPVIRRLLLDGFDVRIAATGAHLSEGFGSTAKEIEADGFPVDAVIDVLQDDDSKLGMSKAIGAGIAGFAAYFEKSMPALTVVLGDRFEIFAAATAAAVACIPIAHIHGGETTEGAVDEFFRHSITKMSYLHFTSAELYRRRVIRMGEAPDRVFLVGALGVENIRNLPLLEKSELSKGLGIPLDAPYALVTFHPATIENDTALEQMGELLAALDETGGLRYIFTKANADAGGRAVNAMIDAYCGKRDHAAAFASMGALRYLSAMKYCELVIGNSSSGILEAPIFCIPTVNIGDRQKGRICPGSVIHCAPERRAIAECIRKAGSRAFRQEIACQASPYGDGAASEKIAAVIKDFLMSGRIDLKKSFYDARGCDCDP
jgi:GDP/UDP-N,N'-diacetylbacillosamine 2-epimerase (hydrolysing)